MVDGLAARRDDVRPPLRAVLFNTTARGGHHGCTLVCRRIDELAAEAGISVDLKLGLDPPRSSAALERFDLFLVNGEGSLHDSNRNAKRIAQLGRIASSIGRPIYLINSTYERNDEFISEGVRLYRQHYARDTSSASEMNAAGIHGTIVPDLSLTWTGHNSTRKQSSGMIVSDSVENDVSRELYALAHRHRAAFISIEAPPPWIENYPLNNLRSIALYWTRRPFRYLMPIGARRAAALNQISSFERFATKLSDASLIITGRFHMFALALDLEIPVLAIASNTRKVQSLAQDIGIERRAFDSVAAAEVALQSSKNGDWNYTADEIAAIRGFRGSALRRAQNMFARIASDARDYSSEIRG